MADTSFLDAGLTYSFLRRLTKKFEKWEAFKTGVIDKDGNILVEPSARSDEQRKSFKTYDLLILKLKRILGKLPGGSTSLASFAAALYLITEDRQDINEEDFIKFLKEEMNTTDGIAQKDNPLKFSNHRVFDVNFETMWKSRHGKDPKARYKKYLEEDDVGNEIKEYCKKNPKKSVILRDAKTGQMMFFRRKAI